MVQTPGRDDLVGDPVVDDTWANSESLCYLLDRLFFRLLLVHRWYRVLVPNPGNARASEGVAFVALEPFGVEGVGDFVVGKCAS